MTGTLLPLPAHLVTKASEEILDYEPVEAEKVLEGSPRTGFLELGKWQGLEVGIWEMTPGAMRDIEVEEIFIVISGEGVLTRCIDGELVTVGLGPGVMCHLEEGEDNRWDIRVALRKIYIAP